ncbi:rho operon leader peptide [Yokenella regensburgei]|nr:rho operon leader peptide [Yokenella regensburgei]MDQ4430180.1 rho operon leader peptide [Yokenella regensburgei]MDR2218514.1 rho operon leader peptide [Yokenella regensburgei]QIU91196.1 rho operon leader peptide [Yokenella regensburgei]
MRSAQIPGLSLIPSCRFSSAFFPVTRQRTDVS